MGSNVTFLLCCKIPETRLQLMLISPSAFQQKHMLRRKVKEMMTSISWSFLLVASRNQIGSVLVFYRCPLRYYLHQTYHKRKGREDLYFNPIGISFFWPVAR